MKKERLIVALFFAIVGALTIVDIISDYKEGSELGHLAMEAVIAIGAFCALIYIYTQFKKEKIKTAMLAQEKEALKEIAEKYQQKSKIFIDGLSSQINQEFTQWQLSNAERDIALFLLKGISPKQISEYRHSSEKTVRHQISAIYKKTGLKTREEFTAYFLEDLLATSEANELQ
tara:strand:- start:121491 stop:122012 length:522 start_codon:yes stop_codon:yes gene_type:complete